MDYKRIAYKKIPAADVAFLTLLVEDPAMPDTHYREIVDSLQDPASKEVASELRGESGSSPKRSKKELEKVERSKELYFNG